MARIEKLESQVTTLQGDLGETKTNYNAKFAATNENISGVERTLTRTIGEVKDVIINEIHGMQIHCASVHALISQTQKGVTQ